MKKVSELSRGERIGLFITSLFLPCFLIFGNSNTTPDWNEILALLCVGLSPLAVAVGIVWAPLAVVISVAWFLSTGAILLEWGFSEEDVYVVIILILPVVIPLGVNWIRKAPEKSE